MKKIINACVIICFLINNSTFGMLSKCTVIAKKNVFQVRKCNDRAQFDLPKLLQQLREQKRQAEQQVISTQEQIDFMETMIKNHPKVPTAGHYFHSVDRDFPDGNMHK
jgi:hypothetical protein